MKTAKTIKSAEQFRQWVERFGVPSLANALTIAGEPVSTQAIYQWMAGSTEPRAAKIRAMVVLAAGAITYQHIHDFIALASEANVARKSTAADQRK